MTDFTYNPELHEYRLNGKVIPSLTNLLRPVYEPRLSHIPDQEKVEEARERGTKAHKDIERLILGDCDEFESGYTEAWAKFCRSTGFVASQCEQPTYHPSLLYGCTPDVLGTIHGRTPILIDIKTGGKHKWHALQTAGQAAALSLHGLCDRSILRGNLHLFWKDGVWDYSWDEHQDPSDFPALHNFIGWERSRSRYE